MHDTDPSLTREEWKAVGAFVRLLGDFEFAQVLRTTNTDSYDAPNDPPGISQVDWVESDIETLRTASWRSRDNQPTAGTIDAFVRLVRHAHALPKPNRWKDRLPIDLVDRMVGTQRVPAPRRAA